MLFNVVLFAAAASATAHGVVHNARHFSMGNPMTSAAPAAPDAPKCDKMAILNKVMSVVPKELVKTLLAKPKPFEDGNVPEFWTKFTDAEKQCLVILYPLQLPNSTAAPAPTGADECVDSTVTITSTVQKTVTITEEPSAHMPTAPASADIPAISATLTLNAAPSGSMSKPWSNGTASMAPTKPIIPTANVTSQNLLPEFTSGQSKLGANFMASAVAALAVAVAIIV